MKEKEKRIKKINYEEELTITITRKDIEYLIDLLEDEMRLWEKGSEENKKAKEIKIFLEYQIKN